MASSVSGGSGDLQHASAVELLEQEMRVLRASQYLALEMKDLKRRKCVVSAKTVERRGYVFIRFQQQYPNKVSLDLKTFYFRLK